MSDTPTTESYESRHLLAWLWRGYLRRHLPLMGAAAVFMILEGSMLGALSWLMQPMFDDVFTQGNIGTLYWVCALVVGIFVVRAVSSVTQKVLLTTIAQRTCAAIRQDMLAHVMRLDGGFHQAHPPGFLIQRVQSDVNAVADVWKAIILGAGRDFIGLLVLIEIGRAHV